MPPSGETSTSYKENDSQPLQQYKALGKDERMEMRKCGRCFAVNTKDKPLRTCARCKRVRYCGPECQSSHWKEHKAYCNLICDSTKLLESVSNLNLIPLPDGLSLAELNKRLAKWVKYHTATLLEATIHALNAPKDFTRIRSHLLRVNVSPRSDHGGCPGKYFRIVDATVAAFADAMNFMPPWPDSLVQFEKLREESDRLKRGGVAMIGLECPPLGVQVVPIGSIKRDIRRMRVLRNWKDILTRDIESGRRMTWFGDNK